MNLLKISFILFCLCILSCKKPLFKKNQSSYANYAVELKNGNIVAVGSSRYPDNSNIRLLKTTSSGEVIWDKIYDSEFNEEGFKVIETNSGLLIFGERWTETSNGVGFLIMNVDNDGEVVNTENHYFDSYLNPTTILKNQNDNYMIVGTGDFRNSEEDIFFAEMSQNGTLIWSTYIGSDKAQVCAGMERLKDGNYLLTGASDQKTVLFKVDPKGSIIWTKEYQIGESSMGNGLGELENGNLIIFGREDLGNNATNTYLLTVSAQGDSLACLMQEEQNSARFSTAKNENNDYFMLGNTSQNITTYQLNSVDNSITSTQLDGLADYDLKGSSIQFTSDNGKIISGYGFDLTSKKFKGKFYLIKINAANELEWSEIY